MANCSISLTVSLLLFASGLLLANFATPATGLGGTTVGGRKKVPDVKENKYVQDLGRYAVKEYNVQRRREKSNGGGDLKFSEVVSAEEQVVSGIKYYLKVAAFEVSSPVPKTFDAQVVVKPGAARSKTLLNFAPSPSPSPSTK